MGIKVNEIGGQAGLDEVRISESEPFSKVKEEFSLVDTGPINMIEGQTILVEEEEDTKL